MRQRQLAHDPDAFVAFYRRNARDLLVFFLRRTFDAEVARDLTAETFAAAFEQRARFRGESDEEAAGWLFGIARHKLSRYLRRGAAERRAIARLGIDVRPVTDDDSVRMFEVAGLAEVRDRVAEALAGIGPDQRQAVQLRVVEERSYAEVAERLGVSEPTARARVSRGLRAIADAMPAMEGTPA